MPDTSSSSSHNSSSSSSSSINSNSSSSSSSVTSSSSSSSSSSSTSWSSYSSSSSSSDSSSSSSSTSLSSYSSYSSSSSSSVDSSSSSSATVDFSEWEQIKPLILSQSAINSSVIRNRLAQTIYLDNSFYDIEKVYVFLYGPYGSISSVTFHMDIYSSTNEGKPLQLLASSQINGATVTQDGWYGFDFSLSGITNNNYLSFVFWQDGGDESNYAMLGYINGSKDGATAWFSNDEGVTWNIHNSLIGSSTSNIVMALNVGESFDIFDLIDYRIVTDGAERKSVIRNTYDDFKDGEFYNTKAEREQSTYGYVNVGAKVVLDLPSLLVSLVIDSSGSVGWNDRLNDRLSLIRDFVDRFIAYYPSRVLFDFISSGAQIISSQDGISNANYAATANLDLNNPIRRNYLFTITSGVSAFQSDVYISENDVQFTVVRDVSSSENYLLCNGRSDPTASGVLTLISGSGDSQITFTAFIKASFDTQALAQNVVAVGFKNLEKDHTYNIGDIKIDDTVLVSASNIADLSVSSSSSSFDDSLARNWEDVSGDRDHLDFVVASNGPRSISSVDLTTINDVTIIRNALSNRTLRTAYLTEPVGESDTVLEVTAHSFQQGDLIDVVDGYICVLGCSVKSVTEYTLTLTSPVGRAIGENGIVQDSNYKDAKILNGSTTCRLLFRDITASRNVTFFVQLVNGLSMEWDLTALTEWYTYNLFYYDGSASIELQAFDINGTPISDGTKVDFFVDNLPTEITNKRNSILDHKLIQDVSPGETTIALDSIDGYTVGLMLDIIDDQNNLQTVEISIVNSVSKTIVITSPLSLAFFISDDARTVLSVTTKTIDTSESNLLGMTVSSVDITPVLVGKNLDTSLLDPSDPLPVSPTDTYESVNLDRSRIQGNVNQVPSISGNALIRILPITEDPVKKIADKEIEENRFDFSEKQPVFINQIEQNQGDEALSKQLVENAASTTAVQPTVEVDGQINSSVFVDGVAESSFSTQSKDFEEISASVLEHVNDVNNYVRNNDPLITTDIPSQPVSAKYFQIFPVIQKNDQNNASLFKYLFSPSSIYIASPIFIYSSIAEQVVYKDCFCGFSSTDEPVFSDITVNGTYADGNSFDIDYIISDKDILIGSGSLRVRIFFSTVLNLRDNASWGNGYEDGEKYSCSGPPPSVVEFNTPNRTDINTFRSVAAANTNPKIALDDSRYEEPLQYIGQEWQLLSDATITITNGRATVTIPSISDPTLLMVEVSVVFGQNDEYEAIKRDPIFILNPIGIGRINPQSIIAKENGTFGEISAAISFNGLPMPDNVVVNFTNSTRFMQSSPRSSTQTAIKPISSKTVNGIAAGILIGPHDTVLMKKIDSNLVGEFESVNIAVSYMGFTESVVNIFQWTGLDVEPEAASILDDFFKVNDGSGGYSDGENGSIISIDLSDTDTILHAGSAIPFLKGQDQFGGLPAPIDIEPDGDDIVAIPLVGGGRWTSDGQASFIVNLNKNIGNEQTICSSESHSANYPWRTNLKISSTYREYSSEENRWLTKTISGFYLFNDGSGLELFNAQANLSEPLKIELSLESYNSNFLRDGSDSPTIVADITWRGNFIKENFVLDSGKNTERTIFVNFPNVNFLAGICSETNSIVVDGCQKIVNTQNAIDGCETIVSHPDVTLTSFVSTVGLLRTTIYEDGYGNNHVHATEVDSNGNGQTISVISLSGNAAYHIHQINNFIVTTVAHSHTLRSVALTQLSPTTNNIIDIVVNGSINYNPTNAVGGRTMIGTLELDSNVDRKLVVKLSTAPKLLDGDTPRFYAVSDTGIVNKTRYLVAQTSSEVDRGFDILANAYLASNDYPDQPVTDGTRIIFDIKSYGLNDEFVFVDQDNLRDVYILEITASVVFDNQTASETIYVVMSSYINWIPSSLSLVTDFTNDAIDIDTAINRIYSVGSSPVHDSVKMASDRLAQYTKITSPSVNWGKIIFVLTDFDENISEFSIQDAIDGVNNVAGYRKTPVIPIKLGFSYGSDNVLSDKYALDTGGKVKPIDSLSSLDEISGIVDDIILDRDIFNFNQGTYKNIIPLSESSIIDDMFIDTVIPSGSNITFGARFSDNLINWSAFSEFKSYSEVLSFAQSMSNKWHYIQYEICLFGNENFVSPEFHGISVDYYSPHHNVIFFQPTDLDITDDEYVSSICVAHEGTIPDVSVVSYGFSHVDSSEVNDYYSTTQPLIRPYVQSVILSRHNELLLTTNKIDYTAINGGWSNKSTIEIYKINSAFPNGQLVDSSEYGFNYKTGIVTFGALQDENDQFVLTVSFERLFRIISNITNYGPDGAIIDSINILYNTTQRFLRDGNGTIIRTT